MTRALSLVAAFLRRDWLVDLSYPGGVFGTLAGAFFSLWSLYFLGRVVGRGSPVLQAAGGDYFAFALVGIAFSVPLRAALSGVSRRVREQQLVGTLEMLVSAPVPPFASVMLLALYPLSKAALRGAALLALGVLAFGAGLPGASFSGALAALALGLLAYLGLGIASAALVIVLKRGDPLAWAFDALTFMLSGILYPVDVLPEPLRAASALLPATHALAALRAALLHGAGPGALLPQLAILAGFSALLLPLSALLLRAALRHGLRAGSLGQA